MIQELDTYDWQEAFKYAGEPAGAYSEPAVEPEVSITRPQTPRGPVIREDVAEIIAIHEGENDEEPWLLAAKLKDGRYLYLEAQCDYTGWG